jgi:hypothetical protein
VHVLCNTNKETLSTSVFFFNLKVFTVVFEFRNCVLLSRVTRRCEDVGTLEGADGGGGGLNCFRLSLMVGFEISGVDG